MQAWQQVKVTNDQSGFFGWAGFVVRTEKDGDQERVFVRLDNDESTQAFEPAELQILG